jgi:hypothetical protein
MPWFLLKFVKGFCDECGGLRHRLVFCRLAGSTIYNHHPMVIPSSKQSKTPTEAGVGES